MIYGPSEKSGIIFEALYWLPNERVGHDRVYIRSGTVPSQHRKVAADQLAERVIPEFVAWLKAILALPENSTALMHEPWFRATWDGGKVQFSHSSVR